MSDAPLEVSGRQKLVFGLDLFYLYVPLVENRLTGLLVFLSYLLTAKQALVLFIN